MEKASEIVKYADLNKIEFYLDYVEILIEAMEKRNLHDDDLLSEHRILSNRFNELLNQKKWTMKLKLFTF